VLKNICCLVDGERNGLFHAETFSLGILGILIDESSLAKGSSVLLTLVFGEQGNLRRCSRKVLCDPREDRATQACVASRSLPASSVHLSGALCELHHVVILSLEFLLVIVAVGLEIPDDLVKGLGSLA